MRLIGYLLRNVIVLIARKIFINLDSNHCSTNAFKSTERYKLIGKNPMYETFPKPVVNFA